MDRLTTVVALSTLAACTSSAGSPKPAQSSDATKPAGRYDFSDLQGKELDLAQFIKECQARTGWNFTYGPEAGAVIETSHITFSRAEPMTEAEFEPALDQVLHPHGLEARHVGPEHLRVLAVCVRK